MPHLFSLLALAFAVSLDGFGVGAMYGLRKIRMPLNAVGIIAAFSGLILLTSMKIGQWLSVFFSPGLAKMIGALILIGIGIWAIYQIVSQRETEDDPETETNISETNTVQNKSSKVRALVNIEIKRLGLIIQILRTPSAADVDRSGTISASEATLLGLALSLDAFGAGIGAALIGYPPLGTAALIAVSSGTFVAVGLQVGLRFAGMSWLRRLSVIPGCLLILMGIIKLL